MNRTMQALIPALALGLSLAAAPPVQARGAVAGVVIDVQGKPKVKRKDAGSYKKLKLNKFVYEGDVIKTGPSDKAAVAFVGGAELRINSNSEFVMESGGGRKATSVFTRLGQAWTRLLHGKAGMRVRSHVAVAAVRGTEADVDVSDRMTVKVYEGLVDLANQHGKTSLQAGQMSQVGGANMAPGAARKMQSSDFGTWQNGLVPKKLQKNLRRLQSEAEKTRTLKIKGMKDGQPYERTFKLKKK